MNYLPSPPITYNAGAFTTAFQRITQALLGTYKQGEDIVVVRTYDTSGTQTGEQRLVLQAPDGTFYKIQVDNSGNLITTSVPKSQL